MPKKKKRTRPGAVAERDIRKLQNSVHLLLSTAPFRRLAREIACNTGLYSCDDCSERGEFEGMKWENLTR